MTEDERKSCSYVWVEPSKIPDDWSNDPDSLGVFDSFCPTETDNDYVVPLFQKNLGLPNPRPVLCKHSESKFLIDGGNGRYYLWHDIIDWVTELYERNLDNILSILRSNTGCRGEIAGIFRVVGCICGPKEDPGPWLEPRPRRD